MDRGNQWARLTPHAGCVHFHTANATVSLDSMLSSYPGPLQLVTIQVGCCAVPERAAQALCSLSQSRWAALLCLRGHLGTLQLVTIQVGCCAVSERTAEGPYNLLPIQVGPYAVPESAAEGPNSLFPIRVGCCAVPEGRLHGPPL